MHGPMNFKIFPFFDTHLISVDELAGKPLPITGVRSSGRVPGAQIYWVCFLHLSEVKFFVDCTN